MKAKILSLLLVVALIAAVSIFAGQATDQVFDPATTICSHCGSAPEGGWVEYAGQEASGHYCVTSNLQLTKQPTVGDGDKICLYIAKGCTVTAKANDRAFLINKGDGAVTPELNLMGAGTVTGNSITGANGGLIYMHANGGVLNIYGSVTLEIDSTTTNKVSENGGIIFMDGTSELNMYGGTIKAAPVGATRGGAIYMKGTASCTIGEKDAKAKTANIVGGAGFTNGGLICNAAGTLTIEDGAYLTGGVSSATNTTNGTGGGSLYVTGTTYINGGLIEGGSSKAVGGNIVVTSSGKLYISGGEITGGTAYSGGNIYTSGTVEMTDGTISSGTATAAPTSASGVQNVGGGNIYMATGSFTMNGAKAEITGGTAYSGGNVRISSGTFDMDLGTVSGGTASTTSGNGYAGGGNFLVSGTLDVDGGTITGGYATANGGNIYVLNTTNVNISNATVSLADDATAITANGANIYVRHSSSTTPAGITIGEGALITCGENAMNGQGRNIFLRNGSLTMAGGKTLNGMNANSGNSVNIHADVTEVNLSGSAMVDQLYVQGTKDTAAPINVAADYAGSVNIRFVDDIYSAMTYGSDVTALANVAVDPSYNNTAAIHVGASIDGSSVYLPTAYTNSALKVAYATKTIAGEQIDSSKVSKLVSKVVGIGDGSQLAEGDVVTIAASGGTLNNVGVNVTVNSKGNGATINTVNGAKVTLIDTNNDDFTTVPGEVTIGKDALAGYKTTQNGKTYVTIKNANGTYSAHRISVRISSINIRPDYVNGEAGIYYGAEFSSDTALANAAVTYGIAADLTKEPEYDSFTPETCTKVDAKGNPYLKDEGEQVYGALVSGVLTTDTLGNYLWQAIYAKPYVTFNPGDGSDVVVVCDETDDIDWSMEDILNAFDADEDLTEENKAKLNKLCKTFQLGKFNNFGQDSAE